MSHWLCAIFFCSLSTNFAAGQETGSELQRLSYQSFSTADGLPSQTIHNTFIDAVGYLWVSTEEGLVRYDGQVFHPYFDDPTSGVHLKGASQFFEDRDRALWVINGAGYVHRYDRLADLFVNVPMPLEGGWSDIGTHDIVEDPMGNFWISGYGGLQYYDRRRDSVILHPLEAIRRYDTWPYPEKVRLGKLHLDGDHTIWCGTRKFGLVKYDIATETFHLYRHEAYYLDNVLDDWVTEILPWKGDTLWIADHDRGLVLWDAGDEKIIDIYHATDDAGMEKSATILDLHMAVDRKHLWVATGESGVLTFDLAAKEYLRKHPFAFQKSRLAVGEEVHHIRESADGTFWLGGYTLTKASDLLFQFDNYYHDPDDPQSLRSDNVYWITDAGPRRLLISTDLGVSIMDTDQETFDNSLVISETPPSDQTYGVLHSDDSYWIGKASHLYQFSLPDRRLLKKYSRAIVVDSLKNEFRRAYRIVEDSESNIWTIDHWGRLKKIDLKTNTIKNVFTLAQDPISKKFINVLSFIDDVDNDRLIVGTDFGLAVVSYDLTAEWKSLKSDAVDLSKATWSYFYKDASDRLWGIGDGRIYRIDLDEGTATLLPVNEPYGIGSFRWMVEAPVGVLWASSYKGILKYQVEDSTGTVYYTSNVGGADLNNPSPVVVKGDDIYFAGSQGITKLDTRRAIAHPTTKPVKFTSLAVNDEPYQSTLSEGDIRLSHRRNDVEATYSNFDFINPDAVTYEYRLLPRDDDWIKNGKDQKVSFYNLSPDDYTLEVKGSNSDGIMHPEVAQLSFTIVPPWWATWWARISALGLVVGGILLTQREVYHGRLRRQKRIEMLRTKISHDLHDDVGSLLTGVAMQSELLELSLSDDKKNLAHQIADQSRTAIARMRDTVWAMDASKDTYADLEDRVHDHLHDVLGQREIQYDTDFTAAPSQERIDPDVRQVLYLICKESITNIAKHSTTDRVMLKVEKGKSHLSLFIKDSGEEKSFLKTSGIGLNSMKQRAESVGGTYSFGYNRVGYVTKVEIPLT